MLKCTYYNDKMITGDIDFTTDYAVNAEERKLF
ncbi:hypothetical protein BJB63x_008730 [Bartonella sp. JB63]|nr:hypothetical protein BJB15x_008830 [Bartonella sp. JB15]AQX29544.1 hypothetical protein BJB63x_008730 [Bartonella sp. JB63]